jgi:hypothetical protein
MIENIILACTNLVAVFSIVSYAQRGYGLQAWAIFGAALASFWYHLIECHNHDMPGIGIFTSKRDHDIFINIDRAMAIFAIVVCIMPLKTINVFALMLAVLALMALITSELLPDRYSPPNRQWIHVISHSVWHIFVFTIPLVL